MKNSSSVAGDSNDENIFSHKFLLTNTQVLRLCKIFANGSLANIELSKTLLKIGPSGEFSGRLLKPLLKNGLHLVENVLKPLAKNVLIPLRLTAASSTDATVHKENVWIRDASRYVTF